MREMQRTRHQNEAKAQQQEEQAQQEERQQAERQQQAPQQHVPRFVNAPWNNDHFDEISSAEQISAWLRPALGVNN